MKKSSRIILLLITVLLAGSCKKTSSKELTSNDEAVGSMESFMVFIDKFHTDSVFAMSRLCDIIYGYNSDTQRYDSVLDDLVMDTVWNKEVLPDYYLDLNTFRDFDNTVEEYDSTSTSAKETIYVPETGQSIKLVFTKRAQKWYLARFDFTFF